MNNYSELSLIYSGKNDAVYSANQCRDKQKYIIKLLKKVHPDQFCSQLHVHQKLKHENIVHLKNHFTHRNKEDHQQIALVLQYCSGGSLDGLISQTDLDVVDRLQWILDIAKGIKYLHDNNVIHRDIKPQNILLARGRAKIGDFGNAKLLNQQDSKYQRVKGTLWYYSPETLDNNEVGLEADVWSFGIVCLQIVLNQKINGQNPPGRRKDFPNIQLLQKVLDEKLRKLIKKMLSKKKEKRPTINQALQKLQKIHRRMTKSCRYQEIKIDLPVEQLSQQYIQARPEWIDRIEPSKEGQKAKMYKIKTTNKNDISITYDDYRQVLKIAFQKMLISYNYASLPQPFKKYFRNLSQLNQVLKRRNYKIQFGTNGSFIFTYNQRMEYNGKFIQNSINSEVSQSTLQSANIEEAFERGRIESVNRRKYDNQIHQAIYEESETSSIQFGVKISNKSSQRKIEKKSDKFSQGPQHIEKTVIEQIIQENNENLPQIKQEKLEEVGEYNKNTQKQHKQHEEPQQSPSNEPQTIKYLLKQLQILQLVNGPQRAILPDRYVNLADQYLKYQNIDRAEQFLNIAIDKYNEIYMYQSDKCSSVFYKLGEISLKRDLLCEQQSLKQQNELKINDLAEKALSYHKSKALKMFQNSLNILQNLNSYDFKALCQVKNKIGQIYLDANNFSMAQLCFSSALQGVKDFSGQETKLSFTPNRKLGQIYNKKKRHHEAIPYLMQCLQIIYRFKDLSNKLLFIYDEIICSYIGIKDFGQGVLYLQKMFQLQKSFDKKAESISYFVDKRVRKSLLIILDTFDSSSNIHLKSFLRLIKEYRPEQTQKVLVLQNKIDGFEHHQS